MPNDVGLYAIFHTTLDPLRLLGNFDPPNPVFYREQAARLSTRAQAVVFPNIDIAVSSPVCARGPGSAACGLAWHSITNLHEALFDFKLALGRSPRGVPPAQVAQACAWYEPLER